MTGPASRGPVRARRGTAARAVVALLALATLATAGIAGTTASADPPSPCGATGVLSGDGPLACTYSLVGSDTFTVPADVTQASFVAVGGKGGNYFLLGDTPHGGSPAGDITGRPGGAGGQATATLALTPGQVLQVDVAGRGVNGTAASRSGGMMNGPSGGAGALGGFGGSNGGLPGGPGDAGGADGGTAFNGGNGSGGGGSSDVRFADGGCAALTCGLPARLLVGAGGGGGGGTGGQGNALGGAGGNGGGAVGADGGATVDGGNRGFSGTGATASAGGTGGLNACLHGPPIEPDDPRCAHDGLNGATAAGGAGGGGNLPCNGVHNPPCQDPNATTSGGGAGGGGGGGLFGGGGGSGGGGTFGGGGGGGGGAGGGSGYVTPDALGGGLTAGVNDGTINAGNGQVTITWSAVAQAQTTLSAQAATSVVTLGDATTATATLSGGADPTGTITFSLYGPGDTSCTTALTSSTATVAGNGSYSSSPHTALGPGDYRWVATYGGDGANVIAGPTSCDAPAAAFTVVAKPGVTTGNASAVTDGGVTLGGVVIPKALPTAYVFEYGPTLSFGTITVPDSAGAGLAAEAVSKQLTGLAAGTTYYYRLVATNDQGTTFGAVRSFTTSGPAAPPDVVTAPVVAAGPTSAVLAGSVNPRRQTTAYTFEIGTTTSFGAITPVVLLDDANVPEAVTGTATGLQPDTTYLYRVVATNATGTSFGTVMSFTTSAAT